MKIAVLAGDGIGPEIIAQALRVLEVLKRDGLKMELEEAPYGGAGYDAHGDPLPAPTLKLAHEADAVLCGAVGGPKYDALPREKRPEQGLLQLRPADSVRETGVILDRERQGSLAVDVISGQNHRSQLSPGGIQRRRQASRARSQDEDLYGLRLSI